MFPLFLPLLAIGAIALLAGGRHAASQRREATAALAVTPGTPMAAIAGGDVPSPLVVLDGFLRDGLTPPPSVILCAIAEADELGYHELALSIVQRFVQPIVEAEERDRIARARAANEERYARYDDYACAPTPSWGNWPIDAIPGPATIRTPSPPSVEIFPHAAPPIDAYPPAYPAPRLHPDPAHPTYPPPHHAMPPSHAVATPPPAMTPTSTSTSRAPRGAGRATQTRDHRANASTLTVSGKSSPIEGVRNDDWGQFVSRVSRELPTYQAARHVGMFRARRDRLHELGIDDRDLVDPDTLEPDLDAQRDALAADMSDAYQRALESGTIEDFLGEPVTVPTSGGAERHAVSLSGILGIIQAAGLEGAQGWLETPEDRRRFPHTTQAFLRTNGLF